VRTVPVRRKEATRTIRLEGELRHSERLHETQTARVAGRIEELFVRTTGEHVRAGQPLAKMYSPALINAQEELLQAIRLQHEQPAIYRAAREKLLDYGLQPAQIQAIEANGQVRDTLQLLAERGGVVLRKRIREGDHVQAGQALFEFIRHSKVWAVFDLHPQDYPLMQEGAQLTIRVEGLPGETFPARVAYIDHHFRPGKRSLEVRAELTNAWGKAGMRLRPGLFATAELTANLGTQLVVPERAVLWTGKRSVVFVRVADAGEPAYQLRELRLGPRLDGQYAVEKGLQEGEQVVAKGAFTVDAAAQLAGKPSMLERHPANQANKHGQHQH